MPSQPLYTTCANLSPEIVVALIFTFYVLSFVIDLLPSTRVPRGGARDSHQAEMGMTNGAPVSQFDARQHEGVPDQQTPTTDLATDEDGRFYRGQLRGGGTKYSGSQQ